MKYFVYAIKSLIKNYVYIGHTSYLNKRLEQHNRGKTVSNKNYRPFKLIYFEEYIELEDAIKQEKNLKKSYNREQLRSLANTGELPKWLKGRVC